MGISNPTGVGSVSPEVKYGWGNKAVCILTAMSDGFGSKHILQCMCLEECERFHLQIMGLSVRNLSESAGELQFQRTQENLSFTVC